MKISVAGYWGAYPEKDGATSCFVLESEGEVMLLDCGSGAVSALPHITPLEDITDVVVSHRHHDHTADLGALVYSRIVAMELENSDESLNFHVPKAEKDFFEVFNKEPFSKVETYEETDQLTCGSVTLSFMKTDHPVPCMAVRLQEEKRSIVYTADTVYSPELAAFSEGADLIIAECSFYKGQDAARYGHMSSTDAGRLAEEADAGELWLTHLPHFGNHNDLIREAEGEYSGYVQLAFRGLSKEYEENTR
ncbi:MBL fold metallo-hydrolase [Alkalicoccus halolimnae]|uniref:MBL fold metallo-hydrolase n=1 Tax=Alkalicoccus halolimnae TaxID=1667239 RepID=A0A5C7FHU1_9BACI|nr:MBL fold metallo-hydrolase [Alkalicoccus halolimnae]TXF85854.1 MBL fold metallo-hydrolase [Alkalicoccus halolimnae]